MSEATKRCPFCAEEILADAKKCKHCGSLLADVDGSGVTTAKPLPLADYGVALLAVPVVATMLIWFWVANMTLFQSPGSTLAFILVAVIFVTAIVASMEAGKVGMQSNRAEGTYSPTAWFFIIAGLWAVGYPIYLYKRKRYGLANLSVGGVLVALVFVASWSIVNSAVDKQQAEVRGQLDKVQKDLRELGNFGFQLPDAPPGQMTTQPGRTQVAEQPFLAICTPDIALYAIKFGGMSVDEAEQHAKKVCANAEQDYVACMKGGADQAACLKKALPSGE